MYILNEDLNMEKILLGLTDAFAQAPYKVLRYKSFILAGLVVMTTFMAYGIYTRTTLDMTTDSFLDGTDPAAIALDEFREQFGSDESIFLVYRAKDGDVFSRESMEAAQQLTDDLRNWQSLDRTQYPEAVNGIELDWEQLNHIRRVQSISNLRYQESVGDSLLSSRLVPSSLPEEIEELGLIRSNALSQDDFLLAFYSENTDYGAILIQTDFGTNPVEGFVSAVDAADVSLDDSFGAFGDDETFDLEFNDDIETQKIEFEAVDMFGYTSFQVMSKAIYEKYETQFEFFPVGTPPLMEFMLGMLDEMQVLGMILVLIFILLLWILFRSFSAVIWPLVTILLSIAWAWGIPAWAGIVLTSMISLTIMLIFAVGIADCVHVMSAYFTFRREGEEHYIALSHAYSKTGLAILVTTVTTMCGVMALTTSDLAMIQVFGWTSAAGVFLAFFFTIVLLPILLDLWHPGDPDADASFADRLGKRWHSLKKNTKLSIAAIYFATVFALLGLAVGSYIALVTILTYVVVNWQKAILEAVPGIVERYPYLIMTTFAGIFVACLYGMSQIRIDSNMAELTREDSILQRAYNVVDENMAGSQSMEIVINTNAIDGMMNPRLLQAVDELQTRIEARYPNEVSRTNSLANIVKETNKVMNDNDPTFDRIPDSELMVSQLLYLFNSSNPEDRRSLVSDDYSKSHISISAYNAGSYQYQAFFTEMEEEIADTFAGLESEIPELQVTVTGGMAIMMRMADDLARSQYTSLLLALGIISVIMIVTLGSFQGGLLAMIPNMIPAVLSFGLMGLFGLPLDADTLLIAPIIIGIAVDDTIHFMTHYRIDLARTGSISKALISTIRDVGQAVMFTTMILALSFALLSFSGHLGMAKMGFFGAIAIFFALLCDLFLIPAMIIVFKPTFGVKDANIEIDFSKAAITHS
jgi:predicted RND superfamily exporter protein